MPGSSVNVIEDAFQAGKAIGTRIERVGDVSYSLHPSAENDTKLRKLEKELLKWINEKLGASGIKIRDCCRDLRTGETLIRLLETLSGQELPHNRFAQNDVSHKGNLQTLLKHLNAMGIKEDGESLRWSVNDLYVGNPAVMFAVLVAIAHKYGCPYPLPSNVVIIMVRREMITDGTIVQKTVSAQVTGDETQYSAESAASLVESPSADRRAGGLVGRAVSEWDDVTSDCEEDEGAVACQNLPGDATLLAFANEKLSIAGREARDIELDFSSGDLFIVLLAIVGRFFVPKSAYSPPPLAIEDKMRNVRVVFVLLDQLDIPRKGIHAEAIATGAANGGSRQVLASIYHKYGGNVSLNAEVAQCSS